MIQKIDAAKYFMLHLFGGIYADMDMWCLRPTWEMIDLQRESSDTVGDLTLSFFFLINLALLYLVQH